MVSIQGGGVDVMLRSVQIVEVVLLMGIYGGKARCCMSCEQFFEFATLPRRWKRDNAQELWVE